MKDLEKKIHLQKVIFCGHTSQKDMNLKRLKEMNNDDDM